MSCNFDFSYTNKSVVIWLKTCQLHLENCWTFVSCSKTQGTAELLLAVPDLEEKPNCMKMSIQKFTRIFDVNPPVYQVKKVGWQCYLCNIRNKSTCFWTNKNISNQCIVFSCNWVFLLLRTQTGVNDWQKVKYNTNLLKHRHKYLYRMGGIN